MNERFKYLLLCYIEGRISYAEHDELFDLIASGKYDGLLDDEYLRLISNDDMSHTADLPEHVSHELVRSILLHKPTEQKAGKILRLTAKWMAAASVILACMAGFYFFTVKGRANRFTSQFVKESTQKSTNETNHAVTCTLPDGSRIVLQPKSSVYYAANKFSQKREVYMEGEAFFKIVKDPGKPFLVYYDKVVTKVLGTSFNIKTNNKGNVEVEVLTGKVQVYENEKIVTEKTDKTLIVTPNQKAVFETQKQFFEAALVDRPVPIPVIDNELSVADIKPRSFDFNFSHAKLSSVLQTIEECYGIEMIVTNEDIYNCAFTGDVSKQELFEKIKIICLATGCTYEVNGTRILIKGNGCKKP